MSSVEISVAEYTDCGHDAGVLLQAAVAVVPHGPEVWAGGGGGGQGEKGDETQEEDAEAAAEHLWFLVLRLVGSCIDLKLVQKRKE